MTGEDTFDAPAMEDPESQLELALIEEFLRARGYDFRRLSTLSESVVRQLLKEASLYATARLAEVEARAHYMHDLHGEK